MEHLQCASHHSQINFIITLCYALLFPDFTNKTRKFQRLKPTCFYLYKWYRENVMQK